MKRFGTILGFKIGLAIFCACMALSAPAFAEDAKPSGLNPDDLKKALGLSIYLQAGYTYNGNASSNSVSGSENDLRGYDHKANSFGLDLAEIVFSKDPAASVIGYKVKVSTGETAKLIHASGLGTQPTGTANPESFDITEAYISYTAPNGKGLRFDIGKMGTFVGAEVIEAIDNPNYSRSFLFVFAEPTTHTGVKASYVFSDNVNAALFAVNGWDNAADNNKGKSAGVSVNVAAGDPFSAYINYLQGPESDNNNHDQRSLLDLVATIKPVKPLSIILNYDNGKQDNSGAPSVKWNGFSGTVKYDLNDTYSLSMRGESFDDKDGYEPAHPEADRSDGNAGNPAGQRPDRATEYRHDSSDKQSFDNGTKKSQDTIALGAMYRW